MLAGVVMTVADVVARVKGPVVFLWKFAGANEQEGLVVALLIAVAALTAHSLLILLGACVFYKGVVPLLMKGVRFVWNNRYQGVVFCVAGALVACLSIA